MNNGARSTMELSVYAKLKSFLITAEAALAKRLRELMIKHIASRP